MLNNDFLLHSWRKMTNYTLYLRGVPHLFSLWLHEIQNHILKIVFQSAIGFVEYNFPVCGSVFHSVVGINDKYFYPDLVNFLGSAFMLVRNDERDIERNPFIQYIVACQACPALVKASIVVSI